MFGLFKYLKGTKIRVRIASIPAIALMFIFAIYGSSFIPNGWMFTTGILAIMTVVGYTYSRAISFSILNEIEALKKIIKEVGEGNLSVVIGDELRTKDEFGDFALAMEKTLLRLNTYQSYIDEIVIVLKKMAEGNMKLELNQAYDREFVSIKKALLDISSSLNGTLKKIDVSSDIVASDAENMQTIATKVLNGASEEAAAIEELTASIDEITNQVSENTEGAVEAKNKVTDMMGGISVNNENMAHLLKAMADIRSSSNEIVNVIQTIEGIAKQTNLLSLNASIEAARAGEMGRGFGVVAGEIGNLAAQSVNAVKETSRLIENTIKAVENGVVLANESAKSSREVADAAKSITGIMDDIASSSEAQNELLHQFSGAIEQIAVVAEGNKSVAIESASMSEELAKEAYHLQAMIDEFELYE